MFDVVDEPQKGIVSGELVIGLRPKAIHQITIERQPINVVFMLIFHCVVKTYMRQLGKEPSSERLIIDSQFLVYRLALL
jgi:hypothetical protein